jgi:hypothetical protein
MKCQLLAGPSDRIGANVGVASLGLSPGRLELDRTTLPIPDRTFGGVAGRTVADSQPDWSIVAPVSAPDSAPNVLIVLIDDAGFGGPETFGGEIRTPDVDPGPGAGLTYNAIPRHGGLLADPGGYAHR